MDEHQTHGAMCEFRGDDKIKRAISVARSSKANYRILIETWWDGDDKTPLQTAVSVGQRSFETMAQLLTQFSLNMGRYKVPEDTPHNARSEALPEAVASTEELGQQLKGR